MHTLRRSLVLLLPLGLPACLTLNLPKIPNLSSSTLDGAPEPAVLNPHGSLSPNSQSAAGEHGGNAPRSSPEAARVANSNLKPGSLIAPGSKSLIIADSMSSVDRNFGRGLVESLSKLGGEACLFSVAGSRFSSWAQKEYHYATAESYMLGVGNNPDPNNRQHQVKNERVYADQKEPEKGVYPKAARGNWGLDHLLATNGKPNADDPGCVPSVNKPFDNLIVQLGTNHEEDSATLAQKVREVYQIAAQRGIKVVKFILPPHNRDDATKHNSVIATVGSVLRDLHVPEGDIFNSNGIQIAPEDYADSDHLRRGHDGEMNWLHGVTNWLVRDRRTADDSPTSDGVVHTAAT